MADFVACDDDLELYCAMQELLNDSWYIDNDNEDTLGFKAAFYMSILSSDLPNCTT